MHKIDRNEAGGSFVEYALLAALIAVVCMAALTLVGQETNATHSRSTDSIVSAA